MKANIQNVEIHLVKINITKVQTQAVMYISGTAIGSEAASPPNPRRAGLESTRQVM